MTLTCEEVQKRIRDNALEMLQIEVRRREDEFVVDGGGYGYGGKWHAYKELNEYAVAEWAYRLLEQQRAAMVEAVERAFDAIIEKQL